MVPDAKDLEARVAATFGCSAPSWLGLEPGQPMDSLTREISSAIQRLDEALADDTSVNGTALLTPSDGAANSSLLGDSDLLPAFVVGRDSLVTRAPRTASSLSASASNLTSIGVETPAPGEEGALDKGARPAHLSSSASYVSHLGLEDDGLSIRLEKGEFTELVRQKSRSVQDFMKLTVVDGINIDEDSNEGSDSNKSSLVKSSGAALLNKADIGSAASATDIRNILNDQFGNLNKMKASSIDELTSSINSSASSTTSCSPSHFPHSHFLAAANSSEQLISGELSCYSTPAHEPSISTHVPLASQLSDCKLNISLDEISKSVRGDAKSSNMGSSTLVDTEVLRETCRLSTPDVTVVAGCCNAATCQHRTSSGCSSPEFNAPGSLSKHRKYQRFSQGDCHDPLPDIVVHDSVTLARGSAESLTSFDSNAEERTIKYDHLKTKLSPDDPDDVAIMQECDIESNKSNSKFDLSSLGDRVVQQNFIMETQNGSPEEIRNKAFTSECSSFEYEKGTTGSSDTSGIATGASLATNCSGPSSSELLSADSMCIDSEAEVCVLNTDSSAAPLVVTANTTDTGERTTSTPVNINTLVQTASQTSYLADSVDEIAISFTPDKCKEFSRVNPLDWSVDSLPPNSILFNNSYTKAIGDKYFIGVDSSKEVTKNETNSNQFDGDGENSQNISEIIPVICSETFTIEQVDSCDETSDLNCGEQNNSNKSRVDEQSNGGACPGDVSPAVMEELSTSTADEAACASADEAACASADASTDVGGEFWEQQMSAWQTAAQETKQLLMEAASSPATCSSSPAMRGQLQPSDALLLPPHLRGLTDDVSQTRSSAYSPSKVDPDSSVDSSPSMKRYPKTPIHFSTNFESDNDSSDSSPFFAGSIRPADSRSGLSLAKEDGSCRHKEEMLSFVSPLKRSLGSPSSSCGSSPNVLSPGMLGRHSSYVSYNDDDHSDNDDMLGYCSEDLNALRAELSLKLPVSPRDNDADCQDEETRDSDQFIRNLNYGQNIENIEVEVVDNERDHVIINYRPPTTLSPIKEEPSGLQGWDTYNIDEDKDNNSTYNSSIEFVDCYADSPVTHATDSVAAADSSKHFPVVRNLLSAHKYDATTPVNSPNNDAIDIAVFNEQLTLNEDKESRSAKDLLSRLQNTWQDETCVTQQPISSSRIITTASNESIPIDHKSLILEDLEVSVSDPTVHIFTARDNIDTSPTLDDEDLLVVDMKTNEASIVETPKPRSHLAFVHSPPVSPPSSSRQEETTIPDEDLDEENLSQLHADYLDEVDQASLPYEINSSKEKVLYLKFNQNMLEAGEQWKNKNKYNKHVRESGPQSIDYGFLRDPLSELDDLDTTWQQRSLDGLGFTNSFIEVKYRDEDIKYEPDLLTTDCLTTNSPNTASDETSQSSGMTFKTGLEDAASKGVSRYQPYFASSHNSLSQIDSSLMYADDHVSLPYAVNLNSPAFETLKASKSLNMVCEEQVDKLALKNTSSLDNLVIRGEHHLKSPDHVEIPEVNKVTDMFIRSEEIDLKDKVMKELGRQIHCINSHNKEKGNDTEDDFDIDLTSSDEELSSLSLALARERRRRHRDADAHTVDSSGGTTTTAAVISNTKIGVDNCVISPVNYESDDYSPETDYTESNERKIYDFFRADGSSSSSSCERDVIPRPMNPEPVELSDYTCTPSPAISIDCSLARADHSSPADVEHRNEILSVKEYQLDQIEESSQQEQEEQQYSFRASSLTIDGADYVADKDEIEDVSCEEDKIGFPSPGVTPGKLGNVRYRMDTDAENHGDEPTSGESGDGATKGASEREEVLYTPDWEEVESTAEVADSEEDGELTEEEDDDSDTSEDNSSSSGEFLWQAGDTPTPARPVSIIEEEEEEEGGDSESGEEDFTPSTWDASRKPIRTLLKVSGSKCNSTGRSVTWKKERHHRVYEYPPEPTPPPPRSVWGPSFSPQQQWPVGGYSPQHFVPQHYMEREGFMVDDGEFYSPALQYNYSQSTFTPAEFYSSSSSTFSDTAMAGTVAIGTSAGEICDGLPPTHQQLQDMLLTTPPHGTVGDTHSENSSSLPLSTTTHQHVPSSTSAAEDCDSECAATLDVALSPENESEDPCDSTIGDMCGSSGSDQCSSSVGDLRHVKEQLRLDLPSLAVQGERQQPAVLASQ